MDILSIQQVRGDLIAMKRTDPRHFNADGTIPVQDPSGGTGFGAMLKQSLRGVNETVMQSAAISQQAMYDPDSVDVHDVTIALAKANTAISLTKSVVDNALKAYREIISIR